MGELSNETYQTAIIIPLNVWDNITKRIGVLENERKTLTETEEREVFYSSTEAASILGLHVLSLGRAKKEGRIRGIKKNGREFQYSSIEIQKYKERYPRYK